MMYLHHLCIAVAWNAVIAGIRVFACLREWGRQKIWKKEIRGDTHL